MKNINNKVKGEEAQGQSAVATKIPKQILSQDKERWQSAPGRITKSQTYELGRHKRIW